MKCERGDSLCRAQAGGKLLETEAVRQILPAVASMDGASPSLCGGCWDLSPEGGPTALVRLFRAFGTEYLEDLERIVVFAPHSSPCCESPSQSLLIM